MLNLVNILYLNIINVVHELSTYLGFWIIFDGAEDVLSGQAEQLCIADGAHVGRPPANQQRQR